MVTALDTKSETLKGDLETIYLQFVPVGSRKEVNVSATNRTIVCEKWNLLKSGECPPEDFLAEMNNLKRILLLQLKSDSFPRFIRSQLMKNAAHTLSKNSSVMVLRVAQRFPYTRKDFQMVGFTKKDLELGRYLMTDIYDWNLVYSKPGINCYYSDLEIFPDVPYMKKCSILKMTNILPYSFDSCLLAHSSCSFQSCEQKH
jgi:hypothetical protein